MSTTVRSTETSKHLTVEGYAARGIVWVDFVDPGRGLRGSVRATRADLIAAVETECGVRIVPADAIVIDRAELGEITGTVKTWDAEWYAFADGRSHGILVGDQHYDRALDYLAAREYEAHPPVPPVSDEDVETLAGLLRSNTSHWFGSDVARRLLATGRVSVTK